MNEALFIQMDNIFYNAALPY